MLGLGSYRTAWFMAHRIREAMSEDLPSDKPLGGPGKIVEADETYFGRRKTPVKSKQRGDRPYKIRKGKGAANKRSIVSLVERCRKVRTFHVQHATKKNIRDVLVRNVSRDSTLYTDESRLYSAAAALRADISSIKQSSASGSIGAKSRWATHSGRLNWRIWLST